MKELKLKKCYSLLLLICKRIYWTYVVDYYTIKVNYKNVDNS